MRSVIVLMLDALATNDHTSRTGSDVSATTTQDAEAATPEAFDTFAAKLALLCSASQESGAVLDTAEENRLKISIDSELFSWETRGVRVRHAASLLLVQVFSST